VLMMGRHHHAARRLDVDRSRVGAVHMRAI
jgi:hypothetical protein